MADTQFMNETEGRALVRDAGQTVHPSGERTIVSSDIVDTNWDFPKIEFSVRAQASPLMKKQGRHERVVTSGSGDFRTRDSASQVAHSSVRGRHRSSQAQRTSRGKVVGVAIATVLVLATLLAALAWVLFFS